MVRGGLDRYELVTNTEYAVVVERVTTGRCAITAYGDVGALYEEPVSVERAVK